MDREQFDFWLNLEQDSQPPRYFDENDLLASFPDLLPAGPQWTEMVEQGLVYSSQLVVKALEKAGDFLRTAVGPNQSVRAHWSEQWFNQWRRLLIVPGREQSPQNLVKSPKLTPFLKIAASVSRIESARVAFMAGGEGHDGHTYFVREMASFNRDLVLGEGPVVLCLEQPSYFCRPAVDKQRGSCFLPLALRLSMWAHYPWTSVITVLPEIKPGVETATHYGQVFDRLVGSKEGGARRGYYLAESTDPHLNLKIKRGRGAQLLVDNPVYARLALVIPHAKVPSTTRRIMRALPQDDSFLVNPLGFGSEPSFVFNESTLETWDDLFLV